MTIRILIVDDHPIVASGLQASLSGAPDLVVVGVAGSLAKARELLVGERPAVVLLDLRLPDGSGLQLLQESGSLPAPPAFIVISSYGMPQYVDAALRHGASGFVLKTAPTAEILQAIRQVADGGSAFPAELLLAVQRSGWVPLSARDRHLVGLLLAGQTNGEIAAALGVTRKAIEAHLGRLFERFGVASRTELAVRAEREEWLGVPAGLKTAPPSSRGSGALRG